MQKSITADHDIEITGEPDREFRIIDADDWKYQRFGWLEAVRRDSDLNPQSQVIAHVLAMDYANKNTMRCDPSIREMAAATGRSVHTIKRALKALMDAGWLAVEPGLGRGNTASYQFRTRAKIIALKGCKTAPLKGSRTAPNYDSQKGADLHGKGCKSESRHNIAKPSKNHDARASAIPRACPPAREGQLSDNPMVIREAERGAQEFRRGNQAALQWLKPWVVDHIRAADLLTEAELQAAGCGLAEKGERT